MSFEIIHQPTQYSCLACVVAMISGDPLYKVLMILGHDGSERHFRFLECAAYLNRCGFHLGASRYDLGVHQPGRPALLIVASSNGEGNHAVFWTGDSVLDPSPASADKSLKDYEIREWWPVVRYED